MDKRVICLMTSWSQRIYVVRNALVALLSQTLKPSKIYLTLSELEFPRKENDLPNKLLKLIKDSKGVIEVFWVVENTKTMKKLFPIINTLNDDDILFNCDDDIAYPNDILESRYNDFKSVNFENPVTAQIAPARLDIPCNRLGWAACGMFTKKMLNGNECFLNDNVIRTYEDDTVVSCLFTLNGYSPVLCSEYRCNELIQMQTDQAHSSYNMGLYATRNTNSILDSRVHELYNIDFRDILNNTVPFTHLSDLK